MAELAWYCTDTMTVTKTLSLVFVSQRTSNCCTLKDKVPATLSPAVGLKRYFYVLRERKQETLEMLLTAARNDAVETLHDTRTR